MTIQVSGSAPVYYLQIQMPNGKQLEAAMVEEIFYGERTPVKKTELILKEDPYPYDRNKVEEDIQSSFYSWKEQYLKY